MSVTLTECWLWGIRAEKLAGSCWKLRSHLRKHLLVIPVSFLLISGNLGRRHSSFYECVAAPGTWWASEISCLHNWISYKPHETHAVFGGRAIFSPPCTLCSLTLPFLLLKCPCSPWSPGVLLLRLQGSAQTLLPLEGLRRPPGRLVN